MAKKILLFILTIIVFKVEAQVNINNYIFSTSNSASLNRSNGSLIDDIDMTIGTTVVLGGSAVTNTTSASANLNFDFFSGGARFTNFTVTPNGWVGLGGGIAPATLWSAAVFSGTRLAPFLGPLLNTNVPPLSSMTTSSIGRVHYKLIGTSPSRIGVIEFLRMSINSSVVDDTNTFQIRLYEVNGAIEYVYGRMKVTAGAPLDFNIGFKIASGAHSVNTSSNTSSTITTNTSTYTTNTFVPNLHNYTSGNQRAFRFIPNPPNDPSNFTISNITNNAMTLNWTDASNETGYVLYRSIDGGLTYTFVTLLAANVTIFNATGLPSNTDVYWRLFSLRESLGAQQDNVGTTFASNVITSVTDGNWNNTATWSSGTIPTANDSVLISAGDTVLVNFNTATCLQLNVNGAVHFAGATNNILTINTDLIVNNGGAIRSFTTTTGTNTLNVGGLNTASVTNGSIINNGIIDIELGTNGVTLNMFGNGNSTITGTPTIFKLRNLQIQKNNNVNNLVEVLTPFTIFTTANTSNLVINSGTLKISTAINLNPYGNTFGSTIVSSINARLWLNHPNAIISSTTTPPGFAFTVNYTINGELRIDNGVLNVGCGNSTLSLNSGFLRMNGGTINILGAFANNNTGTFIMNSGNININPLNGTSVLPNTTAALSFVANSSVTWTGGTINVINPQTTNNNVSVNILQGSGLKSITGGLLKIGNGLGNGTLANSVNTAGFGLTSTVPLYDVLIDTRYDSSTARLVRIVGTFIVGNNLTIASNSVLLPASGTTGGNLTLLGNLTLNGQIIGNFPIVSAPIVGLVSFEGAVNQTIAGTGTFNNLANLTINNSNGVTSSLTNFGKTIRVNLLKGLLTTNGSLVIGNTLSRGTIQIGGIDELTPAGSFNTIPLFDPTFTTHRYIYGPTSSTLITGSFNEMPLGAISISSITINDLNGLTSNRNITILDTLNLGANKLNIGNNNLSIGNSLTQTGIILRTSGFIEMLNNGTFGRWYANAAVLDNTLNTGFPILSALQDRSITLNTDGNPLSTGGKFTVRHLNILGNTNIGSSVPDGFVNVNRVSNSNWIFNSNGITASSFFGLQISGQMQGLGSVSSLSELRWMKPTLGSGGTSNGTGTLNTPIISRLFSQAQVASGITNDTFFVGVNTSSNTLTPTFIAVANGAWDNPLTWNNNAVPTSNNLVIIPSPFNVNLNTSGSSNNCDSLAVLSGATLTLSSNTLNVGRSLLCEGTINQSSGQLNITGNDQAGLNISATSGAYNFSGGVCNLGLSGGSNRTLLVNGSINISDTATLNVNGNVQINNTAIFNQSGGNITIDGNSGTAFTSVLQGKHLLDINTNNINCNAGNIIFVDPPHASLSVLSTHTLRIFASANTNSFSGSHTFIFGNGISTESGNNSGFNVDNRKSGVVPIQNVIINGGNISGRWTSTSFTSGSFGLYVKGNVTINAGSELRQTNASQLAIGGNLINNGTLTSTQTLTLGGLGYSILTPQIVSGLGVFRNSTSLTTAEFTSLTINNGGTSFGFSNSVIRVATNLILTNGLIDASSNTLKVLSTGSISRTTGYLSSGSLELSYPLGTNVTRTYFIGSSNGYAPAILTFPTVTTNGDLRLTINNSDHPQISLGCIDNTKSINKNWNINNISVLPYNLNVDLSYTAGDIDAGLLISKVIGKRFDGSSWSNLPLASVSGTNTQINGLTSNGAIQLGDTTTASVSINISTASTTACYGTNVTYTATITAGGSSPIYQWKKNGINVGTNSSVYVNTSVTKTDTVWCNITSNSSCLSVLNAISNTLIVRVGNPGFSGGLTSTYSNTTGIKICHGSNTGLLTFSKDLPVNIIRWDTMNTSATNRNWGAVPNTSATYTSGPLNAFGFAYGNRQVPNNANFRVIYNYVGCTDTTESNILNFVVDPTTVITSLLPGNTCSGSCTQVCFGTPYNGGFRLSGVFSSSGLQESVAPYTTWTTLNLDSMIVNKRIRAIAASGVCPAVTGGGLDLTVIPKAVKGTLNGNRTICSGSPTGVVYSGFNGFIEKWRSSVAPFTTWNDFGPSGQITSIPITQTTKFVAITFTDPKCQRGYSDTVTITVNSTTVGGSVTGGSTICSGSTSGLLQLSGNNGNVLNWESSVAPFTTWTTIPNTSNIYTSGALTQTTQFRAVVQNGSCANATSSSTTVTVNSVSVGGTISGSASICAGSSGGTLTLSGQNGTITGWEKATSPFTSWTAIANTTNTLSVGVLTDSTKYRAIVQNGNCAAVNSSEASIDVIPASVAGTISGPSNLCLGANPGNLVLTGNIGSISRWESAVAPFTTFTPIANITNTYSPGALTQTTHFRAVVQSGTCASSTTSSLVINISTSVVGGTVSAPFNTVCNGIAPTQSISLNGFSGTVTSWQLATGSAPYTWSNIAGTANLASFVPTATSVNTLYRALVTSGICGTAVSDSVVINVNAVSIAGTISTTTTSTCLNSNVTLTLNGNNGNIVRWESSLSPFASWSNLSSTNNPYNSNPITGITQFRAVVKNGVCPEVIANPQTVNITNTNSWIGGVSNSWHNAANWTCGVPNSNSDVVIGGITPAFGQPQIVTTAFAKNIDIYGGLNPVPFGALTINSGASLSLFGNFSLNYGVNGVGALNAANGTINIAGFNPQTISTPFHVSLVKASVQIGNLNIGGSGDKTFDNIKTTINNSLNLSNANVVLNDTLTIASTANIIGGNASSYIKTLAGRLIQNGVGLTGRSGPIVFPVGTNNSFNPVVLNNSGVNDNFSIRVVEGVFNTYTGETGNLIVNNNAVNKTWFINEQNIGGSNATLTLQWNSLDELSGFSNANSYIARNAGSTWLASAAGAAVGTNPYTRILNNITCHVTTEPVHF
ncbi:MAG: beta strand repeat-containing protein [Candidatus Methylacidiphilales bacterium]